MSTKKPSAPQKPPQPQDKYVLRMPDGLRGRIKRVAADNNRSMNAEIIATLEERYPPDGMDIEMLTKFLQSFSAIENDEERQEYLDLVNDALSVEKLPYTLRASTDGVVQFFPYPSPTGKLYKRGTDEE